VSVSKSQIMCMVYMVKTGYKQNGVYMVKTGYKQNGRGLQT